MCRLSWNALEFTALFLWDNRTIFLYNKQNNTWMFGNMKLFLVLNMIYHLFALLTCEISWSTLEINFIFPHSHVLFSISTTNNNHTCELFIIVSMCLITVMCLWNLLLVLNRTTCLLCSLVRQSCSTLNIHFLFLHILIAFLIYPDFSLLHPFPPRGSPLTSKIVWC